MIPSESCSVMKSLEQGWSVLIEKSSNHRWTTYSRNIAEVFQFPLFQSEELKREKGWRQPLHTYVPPCLYERATNQLLSEVDIVVSGRNATSKKGNSNFVFPFVAVGRKIKVDVCPMWKYPNIVFKMVSFQEETEDWEVNNCCIWSEPRQLTHIKQSQVSSCGCWEENEGDSAAICPRRCHCVQPSCPLLGLTLNPSQTAAWQSKRSASPQPWVQEKRYQKMDRWMDA